MPGDQPSRAVGMNSYQSGIIARPAATGSRETANVSGVGRPTLDTRQPSRPKASRACSASASHRSFSCRQWRWPFLPPLRGKVDCREAARRMRGVPAWRHHQRPHQIGAQYVTAPLCTTPHPSRRYAPIHLPPQGGKEEASRPSALTVQASAASRSSRRRSAPGRDSRRPAAAPRSAARARPTAPCPPTLGTARRR